MRKVNLKGIVAGLFAAQFAVAMAPGPEARNSGQHFIDDHGELVMVDPPASDHQPVFVAIPLGSQAKAPSQQNEKNGTSSR